MTGELYLLPLALHLFRIHSSLPQRTHDTRYAPIIPVPCGNPVSCELPRARAQSDADCATEATLTGFAPRSSRLCDRRPFVSPPPRALPCSRTVTVVAQGPLVQSRPLRRDRLGDHSSAGSERPP